MLLDLAAACDTAAHAVLFSRLKQWVCIRGATLEWFRSYLSARTFCVILTVYVSSATPLGCCVPQGSVLGPLLFSLYLLPLGFVLYVPLERNDINSLLKCREDIKARMVFNVFNFNGKKTEVMVFGGTTGPPPVDLGSLAQFIKPIFIIHF